MTCESSRSTRWDPSLFRLLRFAVERALAVYHGFRRSIGLLQVDAPVLELFKRNGLPGHRATHIGAGAHHAEVAVEIFDFGLAVHRRRAVGTIEQDDLQFPGRPNIMLRERK